MGAPIFTLVAFGGTWHPFIQYDFSPPHQPLLLVFCTIWGRSTYDLGGLPSGVDISVACHTLTYDAFCSHTVCWVGSGGSSLAQALSCIFLPLEGLLPCCRGSGNCLVGCFKSSASNHWRWSLLHHHTLKQQNWRAEITYSTTTVYWIF